MFLNWFNQYGLLYEYCRVNRYFFTVGAAQYDAIQARDMITSTKISKLWTIGSGIVLFSIIFSVPYQATIQSRSGRDYASYHYAVQTVSIGQSPYNVENLDQLARQEGTRKRVHPFFYPPPAILPLLWLKPWNLATGAVLFLSFNVLCLLGSLFLMNRWLQVSWGVLLSVSILLWPVIDSMKMGQINLFIGLLMMIAVRYRSGLALSVAAMTKMSPALLFFDWVSQKRWRPVIICATGCFGLTALVTPWISIPEQIYFYQVILPEFSSGAYHGLSVPINIPANHSIPDLYNQLFPSESNTILSDTARRLSGITNFVIFVSILFYNRLIQADESKVFVSMSLICLMIIVPVYCYEHHLSLLLLPVTICIDTIQKRHRKWLPFAWAWLAFGGMPLFALSWCKKKMPALEWMLQESKWFFIMTVMVYCLWAAKQANSTWLESE